MISIITPVYNSAEYLQNYIDSVMRQTYKEFELILVDDNSSDDSFSICCAFQKKDHRIRPFHLEKNMGASHARNFGLLKVNGEYVMFADSDDYLPEDSLEKMWRAIHNQNYDIVFANLRVITPDKKCRVRKFPKGKRVFNNKEAVSCYLNFWVLYGAVCGKLYTKECLSGVMFPEDMRIGEDGVFCGRAIARADNIKVIDDVVYEYRQRENSTSNHGKFSYKELEDRILQKQYIKKAFDKKMNMLDFDVFTFELYRVVRHWEKHYKAELMQHDKEYKELKEFCDRKWFEVMLHTYNIRIKVRALKYRLFIC